MSEGNGRAAAGQERPWELTEPVRPERKGERTRQRILEAARRQFARVGYERATIRRIAADAEVDKASVMKYFGTKQELFRQAVHFRIPLDRLTTDDPGRTAENYLRGLLTTWAADPDSPMAVLLRTSMTSEEAAEVLRARVTAEVVDLVAAADPAPDARLRAAVFAALMMGIASQRYLLRMPDLAEAELDDVLRVAAPLIRQLISPSK
ncbi:DNA-binding transcriptional regulator, AcrR family [Thermomonospora echinospora]|uniref:DNA-binding transcriptional regulator, AcrR family n=1 Tax=Thermomonospora echinospora TaxID=1992 RepID=A0A1H5VFY6_9ACTN|nr:TetR family transcriptional regulator [Thermomonospora echinospora]SEF85728.1 DNA-binding transcriptional regulator, AcrR family [Thermomonospora echinospora]